MRSNVRFYPSAAAAQSAGFRACKRCRPDATPGSPEWNTRADVTARAMRLIADGLMDREGVPALAAQLGYSVRQLQRTMLAEVGAGPLAVARAQRAQTARVLIETTPLTMADIAFAAGFSSIRQFNDTVRSVFASSPTELRRSEGPDHRRRIGRRLPPTCWSACPSAIRSAPTTSLATWPPPPFPGSRRCAARPTVEPFGWPTAQESSNSRRLLAHPLSRQARRSEGPGLGGRPLSVAPRPGRRPRGHRPATEGEPSLRGSSRRPRAGGCPAVSTGRMGVRAVLGQQVSTAAARTQTARLVRRFGECLAEPRRETHSPVPHCRRPSTSAHLARTSGTSGARRPCPSLGSHPRQETLKALIGALSRGELCPRAGL